MVSLSIRISLIVSFVYCGVFGAINTEGHYGLVRTVSAKTIGRASMQLGLGFNYSQDNGFLLNLKKDGQLISSETYARLLTSSIDLCIGVTSFLDIAGSFPLFYDKAGIADGIRDAGIGDLTISAKLLYPPPGKRRVFHQAYFLGGTIPSGNRRNGIFPRYTTYTNQSPMPGMFYSMDCFALKPMMIWTLDIGSAVPQFQFQIDMNLGGLFSIDSDLNNVMLINIAFEYDPVNVLTLFTDFSFESRWQNFEKNFVWGSDPIRLSPGIRLSTPAGLYILFSGDFGLFSDRHTEKWKPNHDPVSIYAYETLVSPKYGFQVAVGWKGYLTPQDSDKDGIKDDFDRCPKDPEDNDGFDDKDGCPDTDNDKDNIEDTKDKCPNKAEDVDGFEDEDGCPDTDNDNDGITDLQDRCPKAAEDFDGIEDDDGCPDNDNDKDGIQDKNDKCPNEPEDVDNFKDEDGCPDPDNDKDGIPDLKDRCPNKPETLNGFNDEDGCPDEKPAKKQSNMPKHQILEGVRFTSGSTNMSYSSYPYLDPIIREMKEYPEIEIEIRGHTDKVGSYKTNMTLSQKRAESVKLYLVKKGIDSKRIRAIGFGPSSPVADNRTAAGRAKNRRIEIVRIK